MEILKMKPLTFIIALLLFLPLVSGYIIEIDPEGSSGDVVLATQILLQVDGGKALLSHEVTDNDRDDNIVLYISNSEVYLFKGQNYRGIVPQRLHQYVTEDNAIEEEVRKPIVRITTDNDTADINMICVDFERKTESCVDSEGIVECACLNGEWTCDYSSCEVVEAIEETVVQVEEIKEIEEKRTVWSRIRNFFRNLFR